MSSEQANGQTDGPSNPTVTAPRGFPLRTRLALAAIGIAYLLLAVAVWLKLGMAGRAGFDALNYHVPAIRQFAAELPRPNLNDYLSATTPGYHLLMGAVYRITQSVSAVQILSGAFGVWIFTYAITWLAPGLAAYRGMITGQRGSASLQPKDLFPATAIALPLAASVYIFTATVWPVPDNPAWFLVMLLIMLAWRPKWSVAHAVAAGAALICLALVRQIHLWAAGPIIIAAWMSAGTQSGLPVRLIQTHDAGWTWGDLVFTQLDRRIKRAGIAALCTVPAFAIVWYFKHLWGGLTPPTFQGQYPVDMSKPALLQLINAPAAPAFVLALFGVFGPFFAAWWGPSALRGIASSRGRLILIAGALAGLVVALVPATTHSVAEGRWSGLWNIAEKLPTVGHTSVLIAMLSMLGGLIVAAMVLGMRVSQAAVLVTTIAGFAAAQMASFQLWQRYNEPFVLIILIISCGPLLGSNDVTEAPRPLSGLWWWRLRIAGPVVLAALLAVVTVIELRKATPQKDLKLEPGTERTKEFLRTGKPPT